VGGRDGHSCVESLVGWLCRPSRSAGSGLGEARCRALFALLDERIDQSGKLLSLGGIRIDKLWPIHNPRVLGANPSFEVVKLGIESLERMAILPCFSLLNLDF
jgi:hypothetical protein